MVRALGPGPGLWVDMSVRVERKPATDVSGQPFLWYRTLPESRCRRRGSKKDSEFQWYSSYVYRVKYYSLRVDGASSSPEGCKRVVVGTTCTGNSTSGLGTVLYLVDLRVGSGSVGTGRRVRPTSGRRDPYPPPSSKGVTVRDQSWPPPPPFLDVGVGLFRCLSRVVTRRDESGLKFSFV